MQATKKTLTTLGVAALLAAGGIAIAQTSAPSDSGTNTQDQSTMQNTAPADSSTQTQASDTSTLGASAAPMGSSSTTESTSTDTSASPVAQVDRN
jgi:hypothetical protein